MPAPIGNQFWKQRAKHGRDKIFSTPQMLWDAACEYFEWCDTHPLMSYEWNGKDPVKCDLEKMRPYTLKGLCIFLDVSEQYIQQFDETDKDFSLIITRIRNVIYTQKFEGAAAGLLNTNIIARELGLIDQQQTTTTHSGELTISGIKFASKTDEDKA